MVIGITEVGLVMLFVEGLAKPLRGWVKSFEPTTLRAAINKTKDLQDVASKNNSLLNLLSLKRAKRSSPFRRSGSGNRRWMDPERDEEEETLFQLSRTMSTEAQLC